MSDPVITSSSYTTYVPTDPIVDTPPVSGTPEADPSAEPLLGNQPGPAGEFPFNFSALDGVDWDALSGDLAAGASLSVSMTQIMTLLIEVMSQMRQDQREKALADAQSALASGLAAAEKMKDAAAANLTSTLINSSIGAISSGVTIGAGYKGASQPMMQAINGVGQSVGQFASSFSKFSADMSSAEAKSYETYAQYDASRQQADQAFFDQLGQAIKALMDSWKSTESATHQATQAIYNV